MSTIEQSSVIGSTLPSIGAPPVFEGVQLSSLAMAALDDPQAGLLIFDGQLRLVHVTSQISALLGVPPEETLVGADVLQLIAKSALDHESLASATTRIGESIRNAEVKPVLLKNERQTQNLRMRVRSIGNEHRVASFEIVSPEEMAKLRVNEAVLQDSLTGLASRRHFEQTVSQILTERSEEPISILLVNLDRFKAVNDTLGHAAGDQLLRLASERLRAAVRKTDIVARLGGDEFAVLIQPSPSIEEPKGIAQRILDLVQRTYLIEGQLVNVGTSIGIAQSPNDGTQYNALLRSADLALFHSKTSGKGVFSFFAPHMELRAQARRTSELELRRALALRQLELFYQPQVITSTGHLVGFEALIRWRHPERGLIPPSDFLPIAEEIGIMVPIGDWVLRTACKEAMKWPSDVVIAVNASPLQFETGNFADSVRRALKSSGLPGERLEIEITEGILLRNDDSVLMILHELRDMKVRIAMDDFGTGYSSLSQLSRFPFDKIKIDRSLAGFEGEDVKQRAIVRAIAALGQSLGVSTLAEGVENADQLARLQSDGCNSVQGYYFGKPIPVDQIADVISKLHLQPQGKLPTE